MQQQLGVVRDDAATEIVLGAFDFDPVGRKVSERFDPGDAFPCDVGTAQLAERFVVLNLGDRPNDLTRRAP